ncbi:MAG: choice-of-anchor L domain-containing protein [Bacteroidia bacterium]|nr:choice-of-anchor L domain-containing protein [Bacteroidia bacterium]
MKLKPYFFLLFLFFLIVGNSFAQIGIQGGGAGNVIADALVNNLVGAGVTYTNAAFTVGSGGQSTGLVAGTYSNNGYFTNGAVPVGISAGVILSSGNVFNAPGPNNSPDITYDWGGNGDSQIGALVAPYGTFDACGLEFDFVPQSDVISFHYVFASEEYNEYVGTAFNDAFAFFISGPGISGTQNIALIPGTSTPVTINNVNNGTNSGYYHDNTGGLNLQYDGYTTVLTATADVIPCQTYHMKLIITDVYDGLYDSSVFLESGSFTSPSIDNISVAYSQPNAGGNTAAVEGCSNAIITFSMSAPASQPRKVPFYLGGAAILNTDYTTIPDITPTFNTTFPGQYYVTIPAWQTSITLTVVPLSDSDIEVTEDVTFSVQMNFCNSSSYQNGSINIIDNSVPMTMTPNADINICYGASANITANVSNGQTPFTYNWSPVSANTQTVNVAPVVSTVYQVTVTDACGAQVTGSTNVGVYPLPAAQMAGYDTLCNTGTQSTDISVSLSGASPWNLTYTDGATPVTVNGITTSPYTFTVNPANTTTYTITSVSDANCVGADLGSPVTVTVNPLPTAAISGSLSLCNSGSQNSDLTITLTGAPPWTVIYDDGSIHDTISGINNSPYIFNVSPGVTTTYTLHYVSDANCTDSVYNQSAVITINSLPVVDLGIDTALCSSNYVLHAGNPGSLYVWNDLSANESLTVTQSGTYSVVVTNPAGCTAADTVNIVIYPALTATISGDANICNTGSQSVPLTITLTGSSPWNIIYTDGTITDTITGIINSPYILNVSPVVTTTYSLISVSDLNCSTVLINQNAFIFVYNIPVVDLGNDTTLCTGASYVLHAGNPGSTYLWSDLSTNESLSVTQTGYYAVTVTDSHGCFNSDDINVTVSPMTSPVITGDINVCKNETGIIYSTVNTAGHTYTWSVAGGTIASGQGTNQISVDWSGGASGTVSLFESVTATGCYASAQLSVTIRPLPSINITIINTIKCFGDSIGVVAAQGNGGTAPYSFLWVDGTTSNTLNGLSANIYYNVTVTDFYGCSKVDSVKLNQPPSLILQLAAENTSCHGGHDGKVTAYVTGGTTPYMYLWSNDSTGTVISNLSGGQYSVVVTDHNGCFLSDTAIVGESQLELTLTFTKSDVVCYGQGDAWAIAHVTGGAIPYQFLWSTLQNDSIVQNLTAGFYEVSVSDFYGCSDTGSVRINEAIEITATYISQPTSCFENSDGKISLTVEGGEPPYLYSWSTGATACNLAGLLGNTYSVTVTDSQDCSYTAAIVVKKGEKTCLEIPSAFTPNDDGTNDKWELLHIELYPKAVIEIYSRWGTLMYKTERCYAEPWDGKYNGKDIPTGSYIYILNLNDGSEPINGIVTIIR